MTEIDEPYHLFDDPIRYYNSMIDDIESAKESIFLETYRIGNDVIGTRFKDALIRKAKEGVKIKMLVDFWGSATIQGDFFEALQKSGIDIRFFEKIKFIDIFTRGHKRNHRKLLLIDQNISYIGSSNITDYNLNWRESVLRIVGNIAEVFQTIFEEDFEIYNKYVFAKNKYLKTIKHDGFEIVRDMPSATKQRIMRKYISLINKAQKTITIITPYFLPENNLRKAIANALGRGVKIDVIIPRHSDVEAIDILRNKYLGPLHTKGVNFKLYIPHNLHAKLLLIDEKTFSIGSPNFDYRSFRYMYEIVMISKDQTIAGDVLHFVNKTIENTEMFNIEQWKRRSSITIFFEWLLVPFRHLM